MRVAAELPALRERARIVVEFAAVRPPRRLRDRTTSLLVATVVGAAGVACGKVEPPAAPLTAVVTATAETRDVGVAQEWIGTVHGMTDAVIRPRVQGYLLERAYEEGQLVARDALLFKIDPRPFEAALAKARGELARAQAGLGKSQLDVKRFRPLVAEGAVSQRELDDAVQAERGDIAAVASARAAVEQAALDLEWTQVRSPIAGVAGLARAQIGDLVGPTVELTAVSQLDPVRVRVPISEQEYMRFAAARGEGPVGSSGPANLELYLADGSLWAHPGRVLAVNREVGAETGTLLVDTVFPNPGNLLRPGQYGRVRAEVERRAGAVVVPQRAVQQVQGVDQVAVVGADGKVEIRPVKLGPAVDDVRVVESGLRAGEQVVVEGLLKVRNGMIVQAQAGAAPPPVGSGEEPAPAPES
jgi:membrane fusion protein (multidrug efflux system)